MGNITATHHEHPLKAGVIPTRTVALALDYYMSSPSLTFQTLSFGVVDVNCVSINNSSS